VTPTTVQTSLAGRAPRARPCRSALLLLLALLLTTTPHADAQSGAAPAEVGEEPIFTVAPVQYWPGRGLRLEDTGLTLGGFTTVKAETTKDFGYEFALDNLNFFLIYDGLPRFHAVAEFQLNDIFVATEEETGAQEFAFDIRRLFGDFALYDELHIRVGTFLTPVGYWNLILAPPLTWTTEAPLITEKTFFQPTTTGLMLYGLTRVGSGQLGYSVFSQLLKPLETDPTLIAPDYTAAARLTYDTGPDFTLGATYQAAQTTGVWSQLQAFDLAWQLPRGEILGEIYAQQDSDPGSQWGLYLQGTLEVYGRFYAVGRYEHYDQPDDDPTLNMFTVGGVFKPYPFMALKVEYRFVNHTDQQDAPEGFFSSFTTFF